MGTVLIQVDGPTATVKAKYDARRVEVMRSTPGRRWDADNKVDIVPSSQVDALKLRLEQEVGDTVVVQVLRPPTGGGGNPPPRQRAADDPFSPDGERARLRVLEENNRRLKTENQRLQQELIRQRNETSARRSSWAEDLLRKLDPEVAEKAYKRLASVLHPDVGGDNDLMRDLNVAHDLLGERSWR